VILGALAANEPYFGYFTTSGSNVINKDVFVVLGLIGVLTFTLSGQLCFAILIALALVIFDHHRGK